MKNKTIIKDFMRQLREDFEASKELQIEYMQKGFMNTSNNDVTTMRCSCVETEWSGALYYNPDGNVLYFEGEVTGDYGGNKTTFPLDEKLQSLLPPELIAKMKQVAVEEKSMTCGVELINLLDQ